MSELAGIKNQIVLAFNGTIRDTLWGVELPPFDYDAFLANGISFDAIAGPTSIVPFRYAAGVNYFIEGKGEPDTKCMSYVFCLGGTLEQQEEQMKLVGDFTKALTYDWDKFHVAYRALTNEETRAVRTFVYRVYENNGECFEHSEMLCGLPCGMYHCPYCGEMIVAGIPHPSKEHIREYHESEMQADKMIGVQEMKERTVAPEDDPVQRVVSTGDGSHAIPMIAIGEYSDEPVSIAGVDGIVIKGTEWTPGGEEQTQNRADRVTKFKVCAEQIQGRADSIFKKVEGTKSESAVMDSVSRLKYYFGLGENHDEDGAPEPDKAGINYALKFLEHMVILNLQESTVHKIGAPIVQLDHEGIVVLYWTTSMQDAQRGKSDYISFAFYGDGDIIKHRQRTNGDSTTAPLHHISGDMRVAFELIQEYGGNQIV